MSSYEELKQEFDAKVKELRKHCKHGITLCSEECVEAYKSKHA